MNLWLPRQTAGSEGRDQQVGIPPFVQSLMASTAVPELAAPKNMKYIETIPDWAADYCNMFRQNIYFLLRLQINNDSKCNMDILTHWPCPFLLNFSQNQYYNYNCRVLFNIGLQENT